MNDKVVATLPGYARKAVEPHLPEWIAARWFASPDEAVALAPGAEIAWLDTGTQQGTAVAVANARNVRWLNSAIAGLDFLPLQALAARGVRVTNGSGINAVTIAEYVLMGMLTIAKGYREIVRAQERREWLQGAPGKMELCGSRALLLGYGGTGKLIEQRLLALGVEVIVARRSPDASGRALGPQQWRERLGDFDWVILAVPATRETERMIGARELAAMKRSAVLLNVARGSVVDQDALVTALEQGTIGAAFLDVTDPEPLPPDHALWELPNAHITMHLSGRSQTRMGERGAQRFLDNLARYRAGATLLHQIDLVRGY